MNRLNLLSEQIKQIPPYVDSCFDYLNLGSLMTREENVLSVLVSKSGKGSGSLLSLRWCHR